MVLLCLTFYLKLLVPHGKNNNIKSFRDEGFCYGSFLPLGKLFTYYNGFNVNINEIQMLIFSYRFEEHHGFISSSRKVYERAVEFFGEEMLDERLFIGFAKFEEGQREVFICF